MKKSASREPRLPGLTRQEPDEDADTGVVEAPWDDDEGPGSGNARSFAERQKQAVDALGKQRPHNTLRGSPDTLKLGAQTWKPPAETNDTIRVPARTFTLDELDKPASGAVVSEEAPEVAGVIRADDGPARIVSHPPGNAAVATEVPQSVTVSPSVAIEIQEAETVRMPARPEATPVPLAGAATTPMPRREPPAIPGPQAAPFVPPPMPPGESTVLLHTRTRSSAPVVIAVGLISALLGIGTGFALWGIGELPLAPPPRAMSVVPPEPESEPVAKPEPEPAKAVAPPCTLAVRSEPARAEVVVGGKAVGVTPIDVDRACGKVSLEISKKHYQRIRRSLALEAGTIGVVAVTLTRPTYEVAIRSVPRGAAVAVAGKIVGKTPVTISLPGHVATEIELTRRGYRPYKKSITPTRRHTKIRPRLRRKR